MRSTYLPDVRASVSSTPKQSAGSPASTAPDREHLGGLIERVTFHNADNGFCVLRVKVRGRRDLVTVVGHAALVSAGEAVQATGAWVNDREHGLQFRADFLMASAPTTLLRY